VATLKGLGHKSLAGAKKRVRLHPLSVGDATAVIFTVLRASPLVLLKSAQDSKAGKGLPKQVNLRVFANAINSVIDHRKGSIYAASVTSIDTNEVFHSDRFAVSLKRLGVMDDIAMKLSADGFGAISTLIQNKAPYLWGELVSRELGLVQKEVSNSFQRIVGRFTEEVTTEDVDALLEAQVLGLPLSSLPAKLQMLHGANVLDLGSGYKSVFLKLFRRLASNPNMALLNPNSSLEATVSNFQQHLLTDITALQKLLPQMKLAGKALRPTQLRQIFNDAQVKRKLQQVFSAAYDKSKHAVRIDTLYRSMRQYRFQDELIRAAKLRANQSLSTDAAAGLVSSLVGLFFAFTGDTKEQFFPAMKALKGVIHAGK
jgi:hypothetical protein